MQGTPKAIEMKGIVRNATKIGVQDGQAEDLINLRFMDGSWRASGDGRLVHTMSGTQYTQLYVHTNVYHHLLGVNNGTLYWFADIASDGVTFTPLSTPVAITTVVGDIWITQTGHLLTIIDESDDMEYIMYKTGEEMYIKFDMDINGKASDRSLYPFGQVHFNLHSPWRPQNLETYDHAVLVETEHVETEHEDSYYWVKPDVPCENAIEALGIANKKNIFVNPFLACMAIRLYDGSFLYATNPVMLYPRQISSSGHRYYDVEQQDYREYSDLSNTRTAAGVFYNLSSALTGRKYSHWIEVLQDEENLTGYYKYPVNNQAWSNETRDDLPSFMAGITYAEAVGYTDAQVTWLTLLLGSDLVCSITSDLAKLMKQNKDLFSSICIFVTPEVCAYDFDKDKALPFKRYETSYISNCIGDTIFFKRKTSEQIAKELSKQPFFLLKEYADANELLDNPIIDLTQQEALLYNLVQQERLPLEATSRTTYLPKVSYMYNGRLHIANYKSYPFFGYPIDLFHLHNHSVKVQADSWFKGVLPNLTGNNDDYLQYPKTDYAFDSNPPTGLEYFAYITVKIDSSQGEQKVVRYIQPYAFDPNNPVNGRADFIESLNPLLTYPDARAKEMTIMLWRYKVVGNEKLIAKSKTFTLKPHPYLNMAYYIDPDLKPIAMGAESSMGSLTVPAMVNTEEYFPNGLKVSKTDNPMFFPVENAYQVGSAEILALMSNTIAVGTGQTGAAPLYVFCKDGVYALFVDASGQMTYSNSRVLARDVCNNPRSVTPIDAGVVFTTDRGLMMIAGEQVQEIGQPTEGDVLHYTNVNAQGQPLSVDGSKIATDALTKIAGLPSSLCDTTDFLTYLQGAIVNYNHNMRELIVTNPNKSYSYVLDREGNWSRRDYTASQYVNNYPTSYRVDADGHFYKVDDEGDASTSLEHRKEADNQIFYLSNVIKLDSIGFKQAYRFVVRGYFETIEGHTEPGYDIWQPIGSMGITPHNRYDDNCLCYLTSDIYNSIEEGDNIRIVSAGSQSVMDEAVVTNKYNGPDRIEFSSNLNVFGTATSYIFQKLIHIPPHEVGVGHLACVVEGSYDGRKFAPLGFNRKSGKFSNIGCNVEHTDVRFFRVCLSGQVTGKTRIDYMELSANGSVLNTKIR